MIDKQEVGEDCECEIEDPSSGTDRRVTTTTTLNTEKKASPMFDAGTIYWSTTKSRFVLPPHPSSSNGMRHSNSRCFRILIFFLLTHLLCECLYIMCNSNTYGRRSLFFLVLISSDEEGGGMGIVLMCTHTQRAYVEYISLLLLSCRWNIYWIAIKIVRSAILRTKI